MFMNFINILFSIKTFINKKKLYIIKYNLKSFINKKNLYITK